MTLLLPALRADDPLGFLAAAGLLSLAETGDLPQVRLSWTATASPVAQLSSEIQTVPMLAAELELIHRRLVDAGLPAPGLRPDFPVARVGNGTDPMRMPRNEMAAHYAEADTAYRGGDPWLARWIIALTAQTAVQDEKRQDVRLTPFYAPTGKMTLRGSLFDATSAAVDRNGGPADALTRWRRASYDGANFDTRAVRDAAVTTTGKAGNQGAASPTWLALMALRFFTITDNGASAQAVGWQRVRMYRGSTFRTFVWPAWTPPLDAAAFRTLLGHPALQLAGTSEAPKVERDREPTLRALGVTAVFGSSRTTRSQGDGPLGPARRVWPADVADNGEPQRAASSRQVRAL